MVTLIKQYEIKKRVQQLKDDKYPFRHKGTDLNSIPHLYQTAKLNPGDNSLLEMSVAPDIDGTVYMHVFIVAGDSHIECKNSPIQVKIEKSELHKQRLAKQALTDAE